MRKRNQQAVLTINNVRPEDYRSHREGGHDNGGDCTTRCIVACLEGKMDYRAVEAEQYRLAKIHGTRRNTNGTWDKLLTNNGFKWLQLKNLKSRANVASYLASIETPVATLSRSHVCAVKNGQVLDTWDSRGGRVYGVCVKEQDLLTAKSLLAEHGINSVIVDTPRHKVNHYRRRWW